MGQFGKSVAHTVRTTKGIATGDKDLEDLGKSALRSTGFLIGLPTSQLQITGGYLVDLATGEEEPESLGEFAHHLLYRREED